MRPTLAVDIGTTRVKLGLLDAAGAEVAAAAHPTPTVADAWGVVYDLDAMLVLVQRFVAGLGDGARRVERVAIAGVGGSGGLVGPDLAPRSPMVHWHDQRGQALVDRLSPEDRSTIYRVTGLPASANYGLGKLDWALAHADGDTSGALWLDVCAGLAARMTGVRWAEWSLASRTMALDLEARAWSDPVCRLAGVDVSVLPPLRPASHGEPVNAQFAAAAALPESVMVHVVGHDHVVGAVGAALRPGEALNSTGTTEGILMLRDTPACDAGAEAARLTNGVACDGSLYTLFASIPTGGAAYAALQSILGIPAATLDACIADLGQRYVAGRLDLARVPLVVPHFRGSPPPEKSSSARGLVAGLGVDTTAEDIVFGCFLGLAVQLDHVRGLFAEPTGTTKVIGPATANPLWLQLKADVLGTDLSVSGHGEVVSRGGQALASGESVDWAGCRPSVVIADPDRGRRLREWRIGIRDTIARLGDLTW